MRAWGRVPWDPHGGKRLSAQHHLTTYPMTWTTNHWKDYKTFGFEIKRSKGLTGLEINCRGWKLGLERVHRTSLEVKVLQPNTLLTTYPYLDYNSLKKTTNFWNGGSHGYTTWNKLAGAKKVRLGGAHRTSMEVKSFGQTAFDYISLTWTTNYWKRLQIFEMECPMAYTTWNKTLGLKVVVWEVIDLHGGKMTSQTHHFRPSVLISSGVSHGTLHFKKFVSFQ